MSYAYNVKRGKAGARARARKNAETARSLGPDAVHMHSHARTMLALKKALEKK